MHFDRFLSFGAAIRWRGLLSVVQKVMVTSMPSEEIELVVDPTAAIGINRNCSDDYDRTDLHKAVLAADVSRVKSILEAKRNRPVEEAQDVVNAKDCFGLTPLHLAVRGCPPKRTPLAKSGEGAERAKEKYREEEGEGREDAQDLPASLPRAWLSPGSLRKENRLRKKVSAMKKQEMVVRKQDIAIRMREKTVRKWFDY